MPNVEAGPKPPPSLRAEGAGMISRVDRGGAVATVDFQDEGRKTWRAFLGISATIPGFRDLKLSGRFYALDGAEDGKNLYTYFPFLFAEAFPELGARQLRKMSLMALLYLYHILIDDILMDQRGAPEGPAILVSNAYSLKAFEIIGDLFAGRPVPWKRIRQLHQEFSTATLLERQEHTGVVRPYEPQDLYRILSAKSSMAKLIVLVLCGLTRREELLKPLQRSFDLYYLADQMVDDFRDWKSDLRDGTYTYLLTSVITACGLQSEVETRGGDQCVELIGKHLYLAGIAETYLDEAMSYFERARRCVAGINCPRWTTFLNSVQMGVSGLRSNLAIGSRQLLLQRDKYDYSLIGISPPQSVRHTQVPPPVPSLAGSVSDAGSRTVEFFCRGFEPGIGFADFMVFDQHLSVWVSAFVGCSLVEWRRNAGPARKARDRALEKLLRRLVRQAIGSQGERGWAANERAPADADTTAWVMSYLLAAPEVDRSAIARAAKSLLMYRQTDGGFGTYLPDSIGAEFGGWSASHIDVTAVALAALIKTGLDLKDDVIRGALGYLRSKREADGFWQAYWWDSSFYSTYHALYALKICGESFADGYRKQLIAEIEARQSGEGAWRGTATVEDAAFETALALKTLLLLDDDAARSSSVCRAIIWLITHQGADGSWSSQPVMRVPAGNDTQPWLTKEWKLDLPNAVGTLIRDQSRFFTTATALSALGDFLRHVGDRRLVASLKQQRDIEAPRAAGPASAESPPLWQS
ncbi:MAG TPA: prenyltransferase/squalene oxidase repeat-containing protein [Blastocatellia bacterium]|nr:prenyltransferase/squalene oxidase repeat-containing protein [Blastocatellia bacterium]